MLSVVRLSCSHDARSPVTLVSKDQIDILHSLRESVNADKIELETELLKSKKALTASETTSNLRMGQINECVNSFALQPSQGLIQMRS